MKPFMGLDGVDSDCNLRHRRERLCGGYDV